MNCCSLFEVPDFGITSLDVRGANATDELATPNLSRHIVVGEEVIFGNDALRLDRLLLITLLQETRHVVDALLLDHLVVVVGRALVPNYLVTVQKNLSESILRIVLLHGVRSDGRRVILEVRERLTRVPDAAEGVLDLPAHVIVLIAVLGVLQFYIRQLSDFAIE